MPMARRFRLLVAILTGLASASIAGTADACPCSIWDDAATPASPYENDGQPIEVGVKFRSDTPGYVTGLRFYKGAANTGTHVGHLWSATGALLATATFVNETASGWQTVALATPIAIDADTTYVASYHSPDGGFAFSSAYFGAAVVSPPLRALANGEAGSNAVFAYGPSSFPTQSFNASNYWVDIVFDEEPTSFTGFDDAELNGGNNTEQFQATPLANGRVKFERVNPAPINLDVSADTERLVLNAAAGDAAMPTGLWKQPMKAEAPASFIFSTSLTPTSTLDWLSPSSASSFAPPMALMPPALLTSSIARVAPSRLCWPL